MKAILYNISISVDVPVFKKKSNMHSFLKITFILKNIYFVDILIYQTIHKGHHSQKKK